MSGERLGLVTHELEVLGRDRVGQAHAGACVSHPDHGERGVGDARSLCGEPGDRSLDLRQLLRSGEIATSSVSGPCSAWAARSSATSSGSAPAAITTTSSLGPAIPSMPTAPATWRFASCT